MRVVIDARPLSQPQAGGFKTYVRALVAGLCERASEIACSDSILLYVDRPLAKEVSGSLAANVEIRLLGTSRIKSDFLLFRKQLIQDAPDLVMGTSNYLPLTLPSAVPQIVTIHDAMGVKSYPWDVGVPRTLRERIINRYWSYLTRASARRAKRIITVSLGSQHELVGAMGLPAAKFRVVYNGVPASPSYSRLRQPGAILVIESPDPRKNVKCAYRALANVAERVLQPLDLQIVCNGARAEGRAQAGLKQSGLAKSDVRIEILKELTDRQLQEAFARAAIFVWPSRFEGFGLPPLEAMGNGCAVVSSSAPAMPEILGDVPLYCHPDGPEEFAEAILRLLSHKSESQSRGKRGRRLAATFTCRRMADETATVWQEAVA